MSSRLEGTTRKWILYGVTGHTGRMVLQRALERGHRPTIAGRNRDRVRALSEEHALSSISFGLDRKDEVREILDDFDLVVNIAGPYSKTGMPVATAAIEAGCDYLDVTGEIQVFQALASLEEEARNAGVTLLPGCGFEIIPSDAVAHYLANALPDAERLELSLCSENGLSTGTITSAIGVAAQGGFRRVNGRLCATTIGEPGPNVRFHQGERKTMEIPRPDLVSAWRTTGIETITTTIALPPGGGLARSIAPGLSRLLSVRPVRRVVSAAVRVASPTPRKTGTSNKSIGSVWGRASNTNGDVEEAWLRTGEPYDYTAKAVVQAVESIDGTQEPGFQTPASLFGWEFAERIEGESIVSRFPL